MSILEKIRQLSKEKKIFLAIGSAIAISSVFVFSVGMVVASKNSNSTSGVDKNVHYSTLNLHSESPYAAKKQIEQTGNIVNYIKQNLCPLINSKLNDDFNVSNYSFTVEGKQLIVTFSINGGSKNKIIINGFSNSENLNLKNENVKANTFGLFLDNGINWSSAQINPQWIIENKNILFENLPSNFLEQNITNLVVKQDLNSKSINLEFALNSVNKKITITDFDLNISKYVLKNLSGTYSASELLLDQKTVNEAITILNSSWFVTNAKLIFNVLPLWDNFTFNLFNNNNNTLKIEIKNKYDSNDIQYVVITDFAFDPNSIELVTSSFKAIDFSESLAAKKIEEAQKEITASWIVRNKLKIFRISQDFIIEEKDINDISSSFGNNNQELIVSFSLMGKKTFTFNITDFVFNDWNNIEIQKENFSANEFLWIDATVNDAMLLINNDWVAANSNKLFKSNLETINVSKIKSTDFLSVETVIIEKSIQVKLITLNNKIFTFLISNFK